MKEKYTMSTELIGKKIFQCTVIKRESIPELGRELHSQPFLLLCDCGNYFLGHRSTTFQKYKRMRNGKRGVYSCGCMGDTKKRYNHEVNEKFLADSIKRHLTKSGNLQKEKPMADDFFSNPIIVKEKIISAFVFIEEKGYSATKKEIDEAEAFIKKELSKQDINIDNIKFESHDLESGKIAFGCKVKISE